MDQAWGPVEDTGIACRTCGANLSGTAIGSRCPECGTPVAESLRFRQGAGMQLEPQGYVGPILVTVLCCLIGGIIAIVYTGKANSAARVGDQREYDRACKIRDGWMLASIIIGLLLGGTQIAAAIYG